MGADQGIGSYLESVDLGSAGNLEDTDNWLFGTSLFFIPLVIMFVVARLTWRARKKTFGCDDCKYQTFTYILLHTELFSSCVVLTIVFLRVHDARWHFLRSPYRNSPPRLSTRGW